MSKLILIFVLNLLAFNCFAQEKFLKVCGRNQDFPSLQKIFKVKSCQDIAERLSKLQSFSEFIQINRLKKSQKKNLSFPWTDNFPYLYGINRKVLSSDYVHDYSFVSRGDDFGPLDNFSEFKNLHHLTYTTDYLYHRGPTGLCKVLSTLPQLKTISIDASVLLNPLVDQCLSASTIEGVILQDEFKGFKSYTPKTKVIGIEYYSGDFNRLSDFRHLRYLGVASKAQALDGIEAIYKLGQLSHLSINIEQSVIDIEKLRHLLSLEYLNITCSKEESLDVENNETCKSGVSLKNIDFISELTWLKHLNLSFNKIRDLKALTFLTELTYLKLRGNEISKLPDLSNLKNLSYLDLSGNQLTTIDELRTAHNLYFINLSGNNLSDNISFEGLKKLKFLNLSNNKIQRHEKISGLTNLKVLNISGGGGSNNDNNATQLDRQPPPGYAEEVELFIESTTFDFSNDPESCSTTSVLKTDFRLMNAPDLDVLIARKNRFSEVPNLIEFKKLRYLNLKQNQISHAVSEEFPQSLLILNISINHLSSLPNLSLLRNLNTLNLSKNNIVGLANAKFLPESINTLDLSENLISNVSDLLFYNPDRSTNIDPIRLFANKIKPSKEYCPTNGSHYLNKECEQYIRGSNSSMMYSRYRSDEYPETMLQNHQMSICYLSSDVRELTLTEKIRNKMSNLWKRI